MIKFAQKSQNKKEFKNNWKVLIADDEEQIHIVTKSVLNKFELENKGLEFFSAFSGKETLDILKLHPDIDLVLLDVVMESDDAGLIAAKAIREELKNEKIRIVLRTGQPGSAPEKEVILNYDIDDYKEKTELTSTKLFTTLVSSLRASRYIKTIDKNREGLEMIIEASKSIFKLSSLVKFTEGVLTQLVSILNLSESMEGTEVSNGFFATIQNEIFEVIASSGKFKNKKYDHAVTAKSLKYLGEAYECKCGFFKDNVYVSYFESIDGHLIFLYIEGCEDLTLEDKNFLEIFSNNISIAFDNICLNDEVKDTQKELIERLGEVVENRSKETAYHVNRVAKVAYILAKAYGLSENEANKIKAASPMHDIGKIAIPDNILLKPGKLNIDEYEIMKSHAQIGKEILDGSKRELLLLAKNIAYEHHEWWDGNGYPQGLKGEDIDVCGRIVAIADVFDALTQKRVYKEAWEMSRVLEYFKQQSGKQFDPKLIELFFENLDLIEESISEINKR